MVSFYFFYIFSFQKERLQDKVKVYKDGNEEVFRIVKKVEHDRASAPVCGKPTDTFWEAVAAVVEVQMPGRGANKEAKHQVPRQARQEPTRRRVRCPCRPSQGIWVALCKFDRG